MTRGYSTKSFTSVKSGALTIFLKTTLALNLEIEFDVYNNSVWNPNIKKNQIQKNRLTKFIQRYSTKNK